MKNSTRSKLSTAVIAKLLILMIALAVPTLAQEFGDWSAPENLERAVNSWRGESRPFLSRDAKPAHGKLRSQPLIEGCTSPVAFCTAGRASGTINGDFVFTVRGFVPSDTPGVILFTGDIVFTTSRGEVRCQDAGAYNVGELESGPVPFASLCTITGGTGEWAGATGHIRIQGTFSLAGGGDSRYEGSIFR